MFSFTGSIFKTHYGISLGDYVEYYVEYYNTKWLFEHRTDTSSRKRSIMEIDEEAWVGLPPLSQSPGTSAVTTDKQAGILVTAYVIGMTP